jgi:hypothetical protein
MWFEELTGFREDAVDDVAACFDVDGEHLTSRPNGRRMRWGRFETPSLAELRRRWNESAPPGGATRVREVVADARLLHADPASAGSLFQVASQFNALEMASPSVTPEDGIDRYEHDGTQGPACAIACGAGTIHRNDLVELPGGRGQTRERQVDGLGPLSAALGVDVEVRNGYALPTAAQLDRIHERLTGTDEVGRDELMGHLRIGLQWDTEVTLPGAGHLVTQAYASALPLGYAPHPVERWEPFARLVLDAAYEATLAAAVLNAATTGNRTVHLTLLGGGVFGNPADWIVDALARALRLFAHVDLDVVIVSHRRPNPDLADVLHPSPAWADALFRDRPSPWGLRGDPLLWTELHATLRREPAPASVSELEARIHRAFRRLTGVEVGTVDAAPIPRYPTAGMSGGHVAPRVWGDRLVPLLLDRFAATPGR